MVLTHFFLLLRCPHRHRVDGGNSQLIDLYLEKHGIDWREEEPEN
jgi:hypothetical protein